MDNYTARAPGTQPISDLDWYIAKMNELPGMDTLRSLFYDPASTAVKAGKKAIEQPTATNLIDAAVSSYEGVPGVDDVLRNIGTGSILAGIKALGIPKGKILHHSSPAKWEGGYRGIFDFDKVASGEGGTMHGVGLYTSENPKVTQTYNERLGGPKKLVDKKTKQELDESVIAEQFRQQMVDSGIPRRVADRLSGDLAYDTMNYARRPLGLPLFKSTDPRTTMLLDEYSNAVASGNYGNNILDPNDQLTQRLFDDLVEQSTKIARNTASMPTNVNHYQFLLRDKYLPGFIDLDQTLRGQADPALVERLRSMDEGIFAAARKERPLDPNAMLSRIEELKAGGDGHTADLAMNPYWRVQYDPMEDKVNLFARGSHYKGLSKGPRDVAIRSAKPYEVRGILNNVVDTTRPPTAMADLQSATGAQLQNVINNLYAQHARYNPLYPDVTSSLFPDLDERLRGSGIFSRFGIHGNKYLDEGSRFKDPKGTRNYVIWDQDVLKDLPILKIREHTVRVPSLR